MAFAMVILFKQENSQLCIMIYYVVFSRIIYLFASPTMP